MAQRASGFSRVPMDLYQTPAWVVDALAEHISLAGVRVWEPAAGEGKMCRALEANGAVVLATDVKNHGLPLSTYRGDFDFTVDGPCPWINGFHYLITNPPYGQQGKAAERFIELGLKRTSPCGAMALLLPVDFDSGKTRRRFFADCPRFLAKITLTRRIRWFEPPPGQKVSQPSANHAWFVYGDPSIKGKQLPVQLYAPTLIARAA